MRKDIRAHHATVKRLASTLILFILCHNLSLSQERPNTTSFIDINYHFGENYYPGGELEDELADGYRGIDIRYGWQAYDENSWSAIFNYVNYGVGYWTAYIGDPDILGTPMSLYGFINFPVYRSKNIEVMAGPAFGMAFNLKPYDPQTNPQNDLTGGKFSAYFNPSLTAAFKVSETLDLRAGVNFIHMSNGGVKQPNTGFDMYGLNVGVRWHIDRKKYFPDMNYATAYPTKRSKNTVSSRSINVFQSFGLDQKLEDQGTDIQYTVATTTLEYQYKFNEIHGITGGFDLFYDESAKLSEYYEEYETTVFPAIHFGYDLHFWRMAIRPHIGYLLTEAGHEIKAAFFMRVGLTFDITQTLYFQMAVKSISGFKADFGDYGLGLRLFKK